MNYYIIGIIILIIILIIYYYNKSDNIEIPTVSFPFKNMYDDKNNKINVILIAAPFREKEHEELYLKYKNMGLEFCGISSYLDFPNKIINPYEDRYHEEKNHDYIKMVNSWLHCFNKNKRPEYLNEINKIPNILLTEADLKDTSNLDTTEYPKEYDFIYSCLEDNSECNPGWQSYNRNWDLAQLCIEIMCEKYNLKGLLIGRVNCKISDKIKDKLTILPMQNYNDFQNYMKKSRFLFAPNISDASPRVITEAMCNNIPVLVNENILGGWHNVISNTTGELFNDNHDIEISLKKLLENYNNYKPREWYIKNRGRKIYGKILGDFIKNNYKNLNNKETEYIYIQI